MIKSLPFLFTVLFFHFSQVSKSQISTDRPGQSNAASSVGKKFLQVETGAVYTQFGGGANIEYLDLPQVLLRYGLTENLELRLFSQYTSFDGNIIEESGISTIQPGFKYHIIKSEDKGYDLSFVNAVSLPILDPFFDNDYLGFNNSLSFNTSLEDNLSVTVNLGHRIACEGCGRVFYTSAFAYSITSKFSAFAELFGSFGDLPSDVNVDGGFAYLVNEDFQLDISAGFGSDNYSFYSLGLSYRGLLGKNE